ncbi:hypothetical protein [Flavobacterium reichenbachii]|uniref:hypothetical protein n=1 Tax=Flavobacterium reichenbachii TaxID=362418 RepID=UPI000B23506A|nr:hypothetical protein [Flavobacterium reichenbachii]
MKFFISILLIGFSMFSCSSKDNEEDFWNWFSSNQERIYKFENNQEEVFDELHEKLIEIDSNLVFEFSKIRKDSTREFIISADGITESFPAVIKLVEKAPKLKKWEVKAFRQRNSGDGLQIVYDDSLKIAYDDIYFRHKKKLGKLDIELNIRNYRESAEMMNATYILLDGLIGEYDMVTKINGIEWRKLEETQKDSLYKIIKLREIVDSLK